MRSFKSTTAAVTLFVVVASLTLALLAPVSAAPEPLAALRSQRPTPDAHVLAPDVVAAQIAAGTALRHELPPRLGPFADTDRPLQQVVVIEAMASAIRVPRPGPGALLLAGLIGVGAIAWRRAATLTDQRLDASTVLR